MKSCVLFLFFISLFVNRTYCKENSLNEVRKGKVLEPRYHYQGNHPPSAEFYNPIPVSVVYEDTNERSGKSGITTEREAGNNLKEVRKGKFTDVNYHLNHPPSVENYNPIPVAIVFRDGNNEKPSGKSKTELDKLDEAEKIIKNDNKATEKPNETTTEHVKFATSTDKNMLNQSNAKLVTTSRILNELQIPVAVVYDSDSNNYQKKRKTDTNTESPKLRSSYSRSVETTQRKQTIQNTKEEIEKPQPRPDTRVFKKRTEGRNPVVPILDMESYVFSHRGNFRYRYEGGDGTKAYSEGKQITVDDEAGESIVGGYSYTDKDGNDYSLTYTADENGYQPVGAHLPTPPPIPPAIARALAYLATATPEPVTKRPEKPKGQ